MNVISIFVSLAVIFMGFAIILWGVGKAIEHLLLELAIGQIIFSGLLLWLLIREFMSHLWNKDWWVNAEQKQETTRSNEGNSGGCEDRS